MPGGGVDAAAQSIATQMKEFDLRHRAAVALARPALVLASFVRYALSMLAR